MRVRVAQLGMRNDYWERSDGTRTRLFYMQTLRYEVHYETHDLEVHLRLVTTLQLMPTRRLAWSCLNYLTRSATDEDGRRKANVDQVAL